MKIRTGFVSNSSSSSFIIHKIDDWDYEKYKLTIENGSGPNEIQELIKKIEKATGQVMWGQTDYEFFWEKLMQNKELKEDWEFKRLMKNHLEIKMPLNIRFNDVICLIKEKEEAMKEEPKNED